MTNTLWRELLYTKLEEHALLGRTLDVGGSRSSHYHNLVHADVSQITVANLEKETGQDIACDLENGIPAPDNSYQNVLCINVLEHIFNYEQLLAEMNRVLTAGGTLILAVPFIIQYHPSPRDHWRFSGDTLERIIRRAGFTQVAVTPLGTGVFGALSQLSYGVLHFSLLRLIAKKIAVFLDNILGTLLNQNMYGPIHYPLGYVVIAKK